MTAPSEELCQDCGEWFVMVAADPDTPRNLCGVCAYLRTIDDLRLREKLRALLHRRDMT